MFLVAIGAQALLEMNVIPILSDMTDSFLEFRPTSQAINNANGSLGQLTEERGGFSSSEAQFGATSRYYSLLLATLRLLLGVYCKWLFCFVSFFIFLFSRSVFFSRTGFSLCFFFLFSSLLLPLCSSVRHVCL